MAARKTNTTTIFPDISDDAAVFEQNSHGTNAENVQVGANVATADSIDNLAVLVSSALDEAQPTIPVSLRALIVRVRPKILEARRKGLSWKDIAAILKKLGIHAEHETIRIYIQTAKPTRAARAPKRTVAPPNNAYSKGTATGNFADSAHPSTASIRSDGANISPRVK